MDRSFLLLFVVALVGPWSIGGREVGRRPDICAKGQSYWCQNITTAASCNAVKHCIQSVWELERPIEVDKSQICQTCLDMVKQARDQLTSNQTQEEIREVLEGTCKLIPIKIIQEECDKFMDEFGSELVDTLASQMDPQVVCSVAGLCDNNRVHQIEHQYYKQKQSGLMGCSECNSAVDVVRNKFNDMSQQQFLHILSKMCSKTGSYSDACYGIVLKEHSKVLTWLRTRLQSRPTCSLVGLCKTDDLHKPSSVQLVDAKMLSVRVMGKERNDLPCDLCVQLVKHLKDILVANTTESDFKLVLTGICNQMSHYKDECLTLVDQYYDIIYNFLITELDGNFLCQEINICPKASFHDELMMPLIPVDVEAAVDPQPFQLPVTRYNPMTYVPSHFLENSPSAVGSSDTNDKTVCSMCEFFLHFVQQEITLPSTEDKIKRIVEKGCSKLPSSVTDQCRAFVDTYMDELVALLAQEIDPSLVCPMLGVCPRGLVAVAYQDKPTCPLCLLAFQEVNSKLRNKNRTHAIVGDIVDDLCMRDEFPNSLSMECVNFVTHHRRAIVDMVLTEFTPQESCVYIDLCVPTELTTPRPNNPAGDIYTNEIKQDPDNEVSDPNTCVLCEFVMTKVASMLKDKTTEEEIKNAVFHVCDIMPKSVTPKCHQFIQQYADLVIELLAQEMDPKAVCTTLNLCSQVKEMMQASMEKCLLCEVLMDVLRTVLTDPSIDDNLNVQLETACHRLPVQSFIQPCLVLVEQLAPQIETALRTLPVGPLVCRRIKVCDNPQTQVKVVPSRAKCIRGSAYWCISSAHAAMCNAVEFCQKEVWKNVKPKSKPIGHLKGRVVISY